MLKLTAASFVIAAIILVIAMGFAPRGIEAVMILIGGGFGCVLSVMGIAMLAIINAILKQRKHG